MFSTVGRASCLGHLEIQREVFLCLDMDVTGIKCMKSVLGNIQHMRAVLPEELSHPKCQ